MVGEALYPRSCSRPVWRVCVGTAMWLAGAVPFASAATLAPPANWLPVVRTTASVPVPQTRFGDALAVFGNVMVVGQAADKSGTSYPSSDQSVAGAGSAWVVRAPGGDWANYVVDLYLKEPPATGGPAKAHWFGIATAMDGRRIAVSMRPTVAVPAKVFVYYNNAADPSDWSAVSATVPADTIVDAKWSAKDRTFDDFGAVIALSGRNLFVGDAKDDGKDETPGIEATRTIDDSGAVNVYYDASAVGDGSGYPTIPNLKLKQRTESGALDVGKGAFFGQSIAFSGKSLLVATGTGKVEKITVYTNPSASAPYNFADGTAIAVKRLDLVTGFHQDAGDGAGEALAIDDGTAVVGAPCESSDSETVDNNTTTCSGAAYVFHSPGGNADWSSAGLVTRLKQRTGDGLASAGSIRASNLFGSSVAIDGSLLAVGAPNSNVQDGQPQNGQGTVTVFQDYDGVWDDARFVTWHSNASASNPTGDTFDQFGNAVELDSSTGSYRLFVSAPHDDTSTQTMTGSAYVFMGNP